MVYEIWLAKSPTHRALDSVFLEDFSWAGEIEADTPSNVMSVIATADPEDLQLDSSRPLGVGDVITDSAGRGYIFTPMGVWALVEIVSDDEENA